MGNLNALAMAAFADDDGDVSLDVALTWHLRSNHYPPLPLEYVEVAKEVIRILSDEDVHEPSLMKSEVTIPYGTNPLPRQARVDGCGSYVCEAGVLADVLHLWSFMHHLGYDEEF